MSDFYLHASSYVDDGAAIGAGTKVWHFCHIMPGAVIGANCSLGQNVVVMNGVRIGNNVAIADGVIAIYIEGGEPLGRPDHDQFRSECKGGIEV